VDPALRTEGRVTLIDGILATAVLLGLALSAALGWWWADPAAGYVLVFYAAREGREIFFTPGWPLLAKRRIRLCLYGAHGSRGR
jgi:divalent metal cation (Fe/Co/Zn/Cd) transporter